MLSSMNQREQGTDFKNTIVLGTVVNNLDPLKAERLQVTVKGLLEGPVGVLPWVMPKKSRNSAVGIDVPNIGDLVYVEFQDGDIHYPIWTGRHLVANSLPTELSTNYPNRSGFKDSAGNVVYIDRTAGSVVIYVKHKSGTYLTIDNGGNLSASVQGNVSVSATGTGTVQTTGNLSLISGATLTLQASNLTFNVSGASTFTGGGTVSLP